MPAAANFSAVFAEKGPVDLPLYWCIRHVRREEGGTPLDDLRYSIDIHLLPLLGTVRIWVVPNWNVIGHLNKN